MLADGVRFPKDEKKGILRILGTLGVHSIERRVQLSQARGSSGGGSASGIAYSTICDLKKRHDLASGSIVFIPVCIMVEKE
jgi:hypothetical protein